jgi:WD40 repeat protein
VVPVMLSAGSNLSSARSNLTNITKMGLRNIPGMSYRPRSNSSSEPKSERLVLKEKFVLMHKDTVQSVCFNMLDKRKGHLLATGSCASQVRLFDVRTGENITTIPHGNWVTQVAFSPDSRLLAIGGRDNKVGVHDTFTGEEIFALPHDGWVQSIGFAEKFERDATDRRPGTGMMVLVSAAKDNTVVRWPQVANEMSRRVVAFWAQHPPPAVAPHHLQFVNV